MTTSATSRVKPGTLKPGDVLRVERLDTDLRVITEDKAIQSITYLSTHRYRIVLEGDTRPLLVHQSATVNVVMD